MERSKVIAIAAGSILLATALIVETRHFFFRQPPEPAATVADSMEAESQPGSVSQTQASALSPEQLRLHWAIKYAKTPEEFETAKAAWLQWQQQHPTVARTDAHP
jgi:hypothetical protein